MKNYLKLLTNIFLTSISLSVILGSLLIIVGPIYQSNKINRKINISSKSRWSIKKRLTNKNSDLFLLFDKKLEKFKKLDKLINKWENLINKNPDLYVSAFFFSLDNQVYADINPDMKLSAASSIKVPILIVLLTMLDKGEIFWDEKLILTEDIIGSGS